MRGKWQGDPRPSSRALFRCHRQTSRMRNLFVEASVLSVTSCTLALSSMRSMASSHVTTKKDAKVMLATIDRVLAA